MERNSDPISPERKEQLLSNDLQAIIAATLGLRNRPDLSHILPTMMMPCMVFAGEADNLHVGAEECVKHMPNVTWVSLPGLDHGQAMERIDLALPQTIKFLSQVRENVAIAD